MGTVWRQWIYANVLASGGILLNLGWFVVLLAAALLLWRLGVYEPNAGGSGIPQVKGVILGAIRMRWLRILWVKLVGGIVGIGLGLSLGREGPSIQIGAVTAQGLSRAFGRTRMEERYLITAGASAGLAAAFNAPLAGVMFALEELHRNFPVSSWHRPWQRPYWLPWSAVTSLAGRRSSISACCRPFLSGTCGL